MLAAIESCDCQQLEELLKLPHMPKFDVRRNNVSLSALIAKEMDMQLELLLEAYIDVESRDENHMTMLHCAALEDKPRALQMILTAGAQVDAVVRGDGVPWTEDVWGATALLIGAWKNHDVVVRLLLDARADLGQKDFRGETSLYKVLWHQNIESLAVLLEGQADVNGMIEDPWLDGLVVKLLVGARAEVNWRSSQGETMLLQAAFTGNIPIARLLLRARADANSVMHSEPSQLLESTPLQFAAARGALHFVQLLVDEAAVSAAELRRGMATFAICRCKRCFAFRATFGR
eukprot:s1010_g14.t1